MCGCDVTLGTASRWSHSPSPALPHRLCDVRLVASVSSAGVRRPVRPLRRFAFPIGLCRLARSGVTPVCIACTQATIQQRERRTATAVGAGRWCGWQAQWAEGQHQHIQCTSITALVPRSHCAECMNSSS